jgi:hypothetical protein
MKNEGWRTIKLDRQHPYEKFRSEMLPALKSKQEEFQLLGYPEVQGNDIWMYLTNKKWKKPNPDIRAYEIFQDIMSVKVAHYMNYATIEALKEGEAMKKNMASGLEEFKDLFS